MTITLELPPEIEASLLAQARSRGLTLDAFVTSVIANQAAAIETLESPKDAPLGPEEFDRAIDDLFDMVEVPPGVGEGVMHRENWYRDDRGRY